MERTRSITFKSRALASVPASIDIDNDIDIISISCVSSLQRILSSMPPRKRYDSVELKPLSSGADDDEEEEHKSKTDQWLSYALQKLHALLWIVIATALAVYAQLYDWLFGPL